MPHGEGITYWPLVDIEHAMWILDADQLNRILRDALTFPSLDEDPGASLKDLEKRAVLVDEGGFVGILDADGRFKPLLKPRDRRAGGTHMAETDAS
jgi:hypothetical protein